MSDLDSFADVLPHQNFSYLVGIPGGGTSHRFIERVCSNGVTFVHASHEASSAIIAGAITRSSNHKAASISIKGPGLANAVPGIIFNSYELLPSLSISEAYLSNTNKRHKFLPHFNLLDHCLDYFHTLSSDIDDFVDDLNRSSAFPSSPVHLDLTNNPVQKSLIKCVHPLSSLSHVLHQVENSSRIVIVYGSYARLLDSNLIKSITLPSFTTPSARGLLDEQSPYSAGVFTGEGKSISPEFHVLSQAEIVICIGLCQEEVTGNFDDTSKFIFINSSTTSRRFSTTISHLSSFYLSAADMNHLLQYLTAFCWGLEHLQESYQLLHSSFNNYSWSIYNICQIFNRLSYPYNLVLDTGLFATFAEHFIDYTSCRSVFSANNSRYMGTSLPTAVGVSLANRNEFTFCFVGDGGLPVYLCELRTVVAHRLPICFIFFRDDGFGSIYANRSKSFITSISSHQVASIINSFDIRTEISSSLDSFRAYLDSWDKSSPMFIECTFDAQDYTLNSTLLR